MKKRLLPFILSLLLCLSVFPMVVDAAYFPLRRAATDKSNLTEAFNRIIINYTAPTPAKLTVSYNEGTGTVKDIFYLEAGENTVFSALIKSYLHNKTAKNLKIVSAESLTEGALPVIHSIKGEKIPVYANDVLYLEGTRYKIGVKLSWGGGISEIYDKKNPIEGLTNLINDYDTGRNIQQSYYGTDGNAEYKPGEFGTPWCYNPVQGGNKYCIPSRLIDLVVEENSVKIKSQPADWSLENFLTPSYMENTFKLFGECIQVDNRFVDFSGWEHPVKNQELPALYFVSWLGDFVWYSGSKSWENDALSWDSDLRFWLEDEECYKTLQIGQKEEWCAWVNRKADYGIGIFVPNIDVFFAGRDGYNGTKDAGAANTNYVAPLERFAIVSYQPLEYSYLMAAGSVIEIRSAFMKNKDFAENEMLIHSSGWRKYVTDYSSLDFTDPLSAEAFVEPIVNAKATYDTEQGSVCLTATTGIDPYLTLNYDDSTVKLSADKYKNLQLTYMIPATNARKRYDGEVFLCAGKQTHTAPGISKNISGLIADGQWHTIKIHLSADFWKGDIHSIRLDFFNESAANDVLYIREIALMP